MRQPQDMLVGRGPLIGAPKESYDLSIASLLRGFQGYC